MEAAIRPVGREASYPALGNSRELAGQVARVVPQRAQVHLLLGVVLEAQPRAATAVGVHLRDSLMCSRASPGATAARPSAGLPASVGDQAVATQVVVLLPGV